GIKGNDRVALKRLLKELEAEGAITKERKRFREPGTLAPVEVLRVATLTRDGDVLCLPESWDDAAGPPPHVLFAPRAQDPAVGEGDRLLCKIAPHDDPAAPYRARLIRRIGAGARRVVGLYRVGAEGGRIVPVAKGADREWMVSTGDAGGARDGELVEAEETGGPRLGLKRARVTAVVGDPMAPKAISLIAIHEYGIPDDFPGDALAEAEAAGAVPEGGREDLRDTPFVTIDPPDARDRDDAVAAMPDEDPANRGGFVVWVAIADVAHYVRPGSALDQEAWRRGNSTYFPDRVVPMLPERLSADLCSLHGEVERPVLALRMAIDASGRKIGHRFARGLIRSRAALAYADAQSADDGQPTEAAAPVADGLAHLFAAYRARLKERAARQPLHLDLPERRIELSPEGAVTSVAFRDRFDAHKVIEEFMILANVAAAETLEGARTPLLYRVHEEPNPDRLEALRETAESVGMTLAKGQVLRTAQLNQLLDAAAGSEFAELINLSVLRAQTQAYYSPQNLGHFGLNLPRYAHFTSPIRRYSDLIVHRALIAAHDWGRDGLTPEEREGLAATAEQVSQTERRSMQAERDTTDRYLAAYLADRVGAEFEGRVSGIARFGLFVKLDETGADGLVPIGTLGHEYFRHDAEAQTLTGTQSGRVIGLGMRVTVRLAEAEPVTGGLLMELLEVEGSRQRPVRREGRGARRRVVRGGGRRSARRG
ncbi:MAG: ribonuclease R, partial [Pseudomonadota bacterium]